MKIVAADNRTAALEELTATLWEAFPGSEVEQFRDPLLCVKYVCNHAVDLVVMELRMRPAGGTELLQVIRRQKPELPIILLADSDLEKVDTVAYLSQPVTLESLQKFTQKVNFSGRKELLANLL